LNPPGFGNSPYGCLSSYAGNPMLISPDRLRADGLLPTIPRARFPDDHVDFAAVTAFKNDLLRRSWQHFESSGTAEQRAAVAAFERDNKWLPDWALFAALKEREKGAPWTQWPAPLATRDKDAIAAARRELAGEVRFHKYVQ